MSRVLLVTKALEPPWNDSSKNLARDIVEHIDGDAYTMHILTSRAPNAFHGEHVVSESVYRGESRFSPSRLENLRVLRRLLRRDRLDLLHFFFAPNPITSQAMRLALSLGPKRASMHTVVSIPRQLQPGQPEPGPAFARLFCAQRVVTLSRFTAQALDRAGVPDVHYVPPGVPVVDVPSPEAVSAARVHFALPPDAQVILFPGDYQFSGAADTVARAAPAILQACPRAVVVFACRIKQPESLEIEAQIRSSLQDFGHRVQFRRQVSDMDALLAAADLVLLPQGNSYAKSDIPLVLLEAMVRARPVLIADHPPIREALDYGGGLLCPPRQPEALARNVIGVLRDDALRAQIAQEARAAVVDHFNAEKMARRYQELYDALLTR